MNVNEHSPTLLIASGGGWDSAVAGREVGGCGCCDSATSATTSDCAGDSGNGSSSSWISTRTSVDASGGGGDAVAVEDTSTLSSAQPLHYYYVCQFAGPLVSMLPTLCHLCGLSLLNFAVLYGVCIHCVGLSSHKIRFFISGCHHSSISSFLKKISCFFD